MGLLQIHLSLVISNPFLFVIASEAKHPYAKILERARD